MPVAPTAAPPPAPTSEAAVPMHASAAPLPATPPVSDATPETFRPRTFPSRRDLRHLPADQVPPARPATPTEPAPDPGDPATSTGPGITVTTEDGTGVAVTTTAPTPGSAAPHSPTAPGQVSVPPAAHATAGAPAPEAGAPSGQDAQDAQPLSPAAREVLSLLQGVRPTSLDAVDLASATALPREALRVALDSLLNEQLVVASSRPAVRNRQPAPIRYSAP